MSADPEDVVIGRALDLLKRAAAAFDAGRSPFEHAWLAEYSVTADECFTLSQLIAVVLMGYVSADADLRQMLNLYGVLASAGATPDIIEGAVSSMRLRQLSRKFSE